jgi:hypothetical protein
VCTQLTRRYGRPQPGLWRRSARPRVLILLSVKRPPAARGGAGTRLLRIRRLPSHPPTSALGGWVALAGGAARAGRLPRTREARAREVSDASSERVMPSSVMCVSAPGLLRSLNACEKKTTVVFQYFRISLELHHLYHTIDMCDHMCTIQYQKSSESTVQQPSTARDSREGTCTLCRDRAAIWGGRACHSTGGPPNLLYELLLSHARVRSVSTSMRPRCPARAYLHDMYVHAHVGYVITDM